MEAMFITPNVENDVGAENPLDRIWEVYGPMTGVQLSNMTHASDGVWHKTFYELANGRKGVDIPDDLIKEEFGKKAHRAASEQQAPAWALIRALI